MALRAHLSNAVAVIVRTRKQPSGAVSRGSSRIAPLSEAFLLSRNLEYGASFGS